MQDFKRTLRKRIMVGSIFCVLVLIPNVLLNFFIERSEFTGFVMGFFIAIEACVIALLARNAATLKDDEALTKLYIKENDERRHAIKTRAGGSGILIVLGSLTIAMLVSGYFSQTVFFTLLAVVLFTTFVMLATKLYYSKKF